MRRSLKGCEEFLARLQRAQSCEILRTRRVALRAPHLATLPAPPGVLISFLLAQPVASAQ